MKEDDYKEELKAMTDLFVKELALIGCKNFVQSEDRLSFTYNSKSGFVYPHTETFVFNLKKGEGLGELKELIELSKPKEKVVGSYNPRRHKYEMKPNEKIAMYHKALNKVGFKVKRVSGRVISVWYKNERVLIYPIKDWFSGKSVTDGRGLDNLIRQLKK